jgi:hypothetical protein
MTDRDGNESTFPFYKLKLSNGYYYANCIILIGYTERYVNFQIMSDDEVLADSNWHYLNPNYSELIKTVKAYNRKNDFNTIFNEKLETLTIRSEVSGISYSEVEFTPNAFPNADYSFFVTSTINGQYQAQIVDTDGDYISGISFNITDSNPLLVTINSNYSEDESGLARRIIILNSDEEIIGSTFYYNFTVKFGFPDIHFYRQNTFIQDVECGFIPNGLSVRDEQSDFENQNYINTVVFSRPYIVKTLTIGAKLGINTFTFERLAYFFACSSIKIGSLSFKRAKDSDLELIEGTYKGLGYYKIDLQGENNFSQIDDTNGGIFDYTFNETFN